jgi:hypothetical protein
MFSNRGDLKSPTSQSMVAIFIGKNVKIQNAVLNQVDHKIY